MRAAGLLVLAVFCLPRDGDVGQKGTSAVALLKRPRVWLLMAAFGLVNGGYSTVVAWLSPFYREHGWSAAASGSLLAIMGSGRLESSLKALATELGVSASVRFLGSGLAPQATA